MTTKNRLSDSGVSRRDMMRLGAGGLGFGLFGGIGPVPYALSQASQRAAANPSGRILVVVLLLVGTYLASTYGPPPPNMTTVAVSDIVFILAIGALAGWADRRAIPEELVARGLSHR